jgi:predicted enzyme related to lactoylglutathione lyase
MTHAHENHPAGVPCWVETMQPDPEATGAFYAALLGWELADSGDEDPFAYVVARLRGQDVAGIGRGAGPAAWITHVRVERAEAAAERALAAGGAVLAGPIDADPAGRFVVLADPAGAQFCAWEADIREGAELVNAPGAWAMSALVTPDPAGCAAFYRAVFGWETEAFGPVRLFRLPGYVGGTAEQPVPRDVVAVMAPLAEGSPRWDVDFWVHDAAATAAHARELGGRVLAEPHDRPPFRTAVLADPGGAVFSISQLVP